MPWAEVVPLGVIGFCSFLGEGAMHDWSAVYMRAPLETSHAVAALGFAGFALGMTVTRFLADGLSIRVRAGGARSGRGARGRRGPCARPARPRAGGGDRRLTCSGRPSRPSSRPCFSAAGNLGAGSGATTLGWVVTISYLGGTIGPGKPVGLSMYTTPCSSFGSSDRIA